MELTATERSGRDHSSRPCPFCPGLNLLLITSLTCLLLPVPGSARAQVGALWPEVARLLAPETRLTGIRAADLLPVAGWGLPGVGHTARSGGTPAADPFTWMHADLPLVLFERSGELLYRTSGVGRRNADVGNRGWGAAVSVPLDDDSWSMLWGGSGVTPITDVMISGETGSFRRNPEMRNVWLGLRKKGAGVDILAAGGQSGMFGPLDLYTLAARFEPVRHLNLSAWVTGMSGRDEMVVAWRDAWAAVESPAVRSSAGLRLESRLAGWDILIRMEQIRITSERNTDLDHQIRPRSSIGLAELRVTSDDGAWWGALGVEGSRYRALIDSRGLRYGRFLLDDSRRWLRVGRDISAGGHTWRLWAGVTRSQWDGEAEVEFWPFTPTIIDLLGLKRRGAADAGMSHASVGAQISTGNHREGAAWNSKGWEVHAGLDMHALWTDGRIESWEPFLLGLGKTNIITDRLSIHSAQFADLGVVLNLPITGGITIRTGTAQIIPIAAQSGVPPGGGDSGGSGRPENKVEWGGLRWWFTLQLTDVRAGKSRSPDGGTGSEE
ncbi:hypothetical protein ACFL3H_01200 [Gemmatimonadota bacterium]